MTTFPLDDELDPKKNSNLKTSALIMFPSSASIVEDQVFVDPGITNPNLKYHSTTRLNQFIEI